MSVSVSLASTSNQSICLKEKTVIFQDLPLVDRNVRLNVVELRNSDKQIVNELVYRWCRILTRNTKKSLDISIGPTDTVNEECRKILIIDFIAAINPVRLAEVLKRDTRRMRLISIVRGCKINSTYVTLSSYLNRHTNISGTLKLIVIYQDEFFILKTLDLLKECILLLKCRVLLVIPRLDRSERDILNLISNHQILSCNFCTSRRDIKPAPPGMLNESYQSYLNQIYFHRSKSDEGLPENVYGELKEDGLYLNEFKPPEKKKADYDDTQKKKFKSVD